MDEMKEFVAYLRRLKRDIEDIERLLEEDDTERAKELLKQLKEDTQKDIEA